jgi:protocatechuate 3,4-dioxygenase beta subunit
LVEVFMNQLSKPTRRRFLLNTGLIAAGWELSSACDVHAQELAPTLSCHDGDEPTVRQTEGPFFKPKSPERSDLREPDSSGRQFDLSGFVLTRHCSPLGGAVVDLWHADETGEYDTAALYLRRNSISLTSQQTSATASSSARY